MANKNFIVIENGVVNNFIIAEEGSELTNDNLIPLGTTPVGFGWMYADGVFTPPPPPPRDIEAEWGGVRLIRDRLLTESDINVLPDRWAAMTAEKQQEWTVYRQTLRDIPQLYLDPADVVWPVKPE